MIYPKSKPLIPNLTKNKAAKIMPIQGEKYKIKIAIQQYALEETQVISFRKFLNSLLLCFHI